MSNGNNEELAKGFMVIKDGEMEMSSGSLSGQHQLAPLFQRLISGKESVVRTGESFHSITIAYPDFFYKVSRNQDRIYVSKVGQKAPKAEPTDGITSPPVDEMVEDCEQSSDEMPIQSTPPDASAELRRIATDGSLSQRAQFAAVPDQL